MRLMTHFAAAGHGTPLTPPLCAGCLSNPTPFYRRVRPLPSGHLARLSAVGGAGMALAVAGAGAGKKTTGN